jgi:hypothetical protein
MNISGIWKYLAAWFVMLLASIVNGTVRDFVYGPYVSELAAHQLSTVTSVLLLGAIMWVFVRRYPPSGERQAVAIGLFWMSLTVAFEFLFFHYVGGHSWSALLANYDIVAGRVWVLVLLWLAVGPYLFFRLRRA